MRILFRPSIVLLAAAVLAPVARAQSEPAKNTVRAEALREIAYFEQRYVSLAERIPADKLGWRPGTGVRSISEVLLHVAGANYGLPGFIGTKPPQLFTPQGWETSTTDKAKIVATLKDSFAHYRNAVLAMGDQDAEKTVQVFGQEHTYRSFLSFLSRHLGEHLGQTIAYARMNGIVPPWTEERQRRP